MPPLVGLDSWQGTYSGEASMMLPQRWMPTHPINIGASFFLSRVMEKKYLHNSKWGSIPRYPSHSAIKAVMCWIPFGFR